MTPRPAPVIAIDGPAGAGKSTAARALAEALGFLLVDTGALYRAVALAAQEQGVPWTDGDALGELASKLNLHLETSPQGGIRTWINGRDRSEEIRTPEISKGASDVSAHGPVRSALLGLQRKVGGLGGVVLEGRDIGTVVFPDAEVKVFLTASPEERARRRLAELRSRGVDADFETTLRDIEERDKQDSSRAVAPLRKAYDAVELDTTGLSLDEVIAALVKIVQARGFGAG